MKIDYQRIVPVVDGITETQILALADGKVVGRVGIAAFEDHASIRQLWVNPECRGNGIGKTLMAICQQIASTSKCECVTLSCQGHELRRWYERLGYKRFDKSAVGFHMMKIL